MLQLLQQSFRRQHPLLTDHNVRETLSITDRAYLIHDGKVFLEGLPDEIAHNEEAKKWYLGENFTW